MRYVLPLLLALAAPTASAAVSVTADFNNARGTSPASTFGLNIWHGLNPTNSERQAYRDNLAYLGPTFLRIHASEMAHGSMPTATGCPRRSTACSTRSPPRAVS